MKKLVKLQMTCGACPEQYEGELDTGEHVYIRFRWGEGKIELDGKIVMSCQVDDEWLGTFPDGMLGELLEDAKIDPANVQDLLEANIKSYGY